MGGLSTHVQEPLAISRRGCTGRDLNEKMLAADNGNKQSSKESRWDESDVSEGVKVIVLF